MIKKEKVLVRDNKGAFLKMFKRKFKNEFEFSEDSFLLENGSELKNFDRSIFVVYDKTELIDFLKLEKKGTNVMLCLFDKQLHNSFTFFKDIKNLFLVDASQNRTEIFKDLKIYFTSKSDFVPKLPDMKFLNLNPGQVQFDNFQKALFFMS
jgi:hypothetical protein